MNAKGIELGIRAISCAKWQWREGMLIGATKHLLGHGQTSIPKSYGSGRVIGVNYYEERCAYGTPIVENDEFAEEVDGPIPDLFDSATKGCLLDLVRQAWLNPSIYLAPFYTNTDDGEVVWWAIASNTVWETQPRIEYLTRSQGIVEHYLAAETEIEALVVALENAPLAVDSLNKL